MAELLADPLRRHNASGAISFRSRQGAMRRVYVQRAARATQSEFADGLMQGFGSLDAFQFGNFVLELQLAPLQLRQSALIRRWVMPFAFDVTVEGVVTAFKLSEVTFQRHALLLWETHPRR
jgi:hypothetical protein